MLGCGWWCSMSAPPLLLLLLVALSSHIVSAFPTVGAPQDLSAGTCAVGDVVYMSGDEFPGATACDRCACAANGTVHCTRQRCAPRPGCKAIHRPDHCCPTYQCECEQEGRVYGNGEKLVDPADPCRVCYCQGGEVVCRRIACFLRDDCQPRTVPGRCCPEYDNCPLTGVTASPSAAAAAAAAATSTSSQHNATSKPASPTLSNEPIKQEITIKEITPVSEIPVLTGVKIKEILPVTNVDINEYTVSSKAPLIPREVSTHVPDIIAEVVTPVIATEPPVSVETSSTNSNIKDISDSKVTTIDFPKNQSPQDSNDNERLISAKPTSLILSSTSSKVATDSSITPPTKVVVTEEEDNSFVEHNPAFPPLPDDLSAVGEHADETVVEGSTDTETSSPVTNIPLEASSSTPSATSIQYHLTERSLIDSRSEQDGSTIGTTVPKKDSPMLNLRSAISTEILNLPSSVSEDVDSDLEDDASTVPPVVITENKVPTAPTETTYFSKDLSKDTTESVLNVTLDSSLGNIFSENSSDSIISTTENRPIEQELSTVKQNITTPKSNVDLTFETVTSKIQGETASTIDNTQNITIESHTQKSNSGAPFIETTTSITNYNATSGYATSVKTESVTPIISLLSSTFETTTIVEEEKTTEGGKFANTEALPTVATGDVEVIRNTENKTQKLPIVESRNVGKNNVLNDLINLVGDVASISGDASDREVATPATPSTEEPSNVSYKSKNNNRNANSITEIPQKPKGSSDKIKSVEIEDEDEESVTDSPPPFDKVEPTTKRPIIDEVSADRDISGNKTVKKDIEIITQSYVPTISKRPTKVVLKETAESEQERAD